jgi:hypothetical protein
MALALNRPVTLHCPTRSAVAGLGLMEGQPKAEDCALNNSRVTPLKYNPLDVECHLNRLCAHKDMHPESKIEYIHAFAAKIC